MRGYFDRRSWNTERHGHLYTDRQVQNQVNHYLRSAYPYRGRVDWSEFGMQGDDFCSFDCSDRLVRYFEPGAVKV